MKIQFEIDIKIPCQGEQLIRAALAKLPEVSVDNVRGYDRLVSALERAEAVRILKQQSEEELRAASSIVRHYVESQWADHEIPAETKAMLSVW